VIIIADIPGLGPAQRYPDIRAIALQAEQDGFDSIWLHDHLLYRTEDEATLGIWECWTMLTALAEATRRVEVGTLVACTQFRNPAILAKMAVTLDEISNGRLVLGIGAGWNEPEFDAFGIPFDHRVDRFEEAVQIIQPLLKTGRVDFQGKYYQARNCEIAPRGPRPDGPLLMIAAIGPRMMRLADTTYLGGPETLAGPRAEIQGTCREIVRDPASLKVTGVVALQFTDMYSQPAFEQYLSGSVEEVAAAIRAYEQAGTDHLMFQVVPYIPEAYRRLVQAFKLYRGQG
jgi:alkanesulfonate monooxygenase SsuD/methylene tetrahydromethanopterin reductase-like flavin-dependent oxidoreductase (luciferase family)